MKYVILFALLTSSGLAQYQEASITRTTSTNSVFPRQFPSMTIRKMNNNEYWLFESLGTNTIFHRQFPTYIVRKENYGVDHPNQKWGVYRTTSTNSVFPQQFPDRYISALEPTAIKEEEKASNIQIEKQQYRSTSSYFSSPNPSPSENNSYTYSKSLRQDKKSSYSGETP